MKYIYVILILCGIISAYSQIQTDVSDKNWSIVIPIADATNIDMKQCVLGTVKDSLVTSFVKNIGKWKIQVDSIYFRGFDDDAFELVSGFPKYEVQVGNNEFGEFRFRPTRVGIHNAEIVIITKLDTLIKSITGEGVSPQLQVVNDFIDFGKVDIGASKDTIDVITIKNIGSASLFITKTLHNKPNDQDFTTVSGGGAFELKKDEVCRMHLKYTASSLGKTTGILEFHYNGAGSPASVVLFGEGVNKDPQISVMPFAFPDLICDSSEISVLEITNIGDKTLVINDIKKSSAIMEEFEILTPLPINVEPKDIQKVEIEFKPQSVGNKSLNLEIISNSLTNSSYTIVADAKKESVDLVPEFDKINLGFLCPNEEKNFSLKISNAGTQNAGAYFMKSNYFTFNMDEFTIEKIQSTIIDVVYKANANEGAFNDTISYLDSICGIQKNVIVYGTIELPKIEVLPLEITSFIGQSKIGKLRIKNISNRNLSISGVQINSKKFEYVNTVFPLNLAVDLDTIIEIKYSATDTLIEITDMLIEIEPCSQYQIVQIKGMPASAFAKIHLENIEAYANEIIELPIYLDENNLKSASINSFIGDLYYNPTLLEPIDLSGEIINPSLAKLNITVSSIEFNPISKIRFRAGLGNSDTCNLIFDNLKPFTGIADFDIRNSKFKLLGICLEGGKRLINPNAQSNKLQTQINTIANQIEINFSLIEKNTSKLSVYDYKGRKLIDKSIESSVGNHSLNLELTEFSNGIYFIILETPSMIESSSFIINK